MFGDKTPMRMLALSVFQQQFGDLFSVKAEITDFEKGLIEGTYELLWFENNAKRDSKSWGETLRAAYHFLESGFQKKPSKVAKAFFASINHVVPSMNHSFSMKRKAEQINESLPDDKIVAFLSCYKTLYEGLFPVIAAPIVYSFSIYKKITDPLFKLHADGRISLGAIAKMEKWLIYPQNRLAIGLNNHVRNAYSHEKYRVLDGGFVQLWDNDPRSKKTWGPETWSLDDLRGLCDELWYNSQAIICAMALFSINNRRTMVERGWVHIDPAPPLRTEELKHTIESLASERSFSLNSMEKNDGNLTLNFSTRLKGIDQDEEIFVGGNHPRKFIRPIKYVEVRVIEQALGLLQAIGVMLDGVNDINMSFVDPDNNDLGSISIQYNNISKISGPKLSTVDADRRILNKDTLGSQTMWRRDEYPPYEI